MVSLRAAEGGEAISLLTVGDCFGGCAALPSPEQGAHAVRPYKVFLVWGL